MADLRELLADFTGSTADELHTHIQSKASDLGYKVFVDDGKKDIYIPKYRLDAEIAKTKNLKTTLDAQADSLKQLETLTGDNEKAKTTIATLQQQLADAQVASNNAIIEAALVSKAGEAKFKGPAKDLLSFIDTEKVLVKDGVVVGLDEEIASIQKSKAYLFDAVEDLKKGKSGDPGRPNFGAMFDGTNAKPGAFGDLLSEQSADTDTAGTYDYFK